MGAGTLRACAEVGTALGLVCEAYGQGVQCNPWETWLATHPIPPACNQLTSSKRSLLPTVANVARHGELLAAALWSA